jgi:glycosyltransferase involved in cell wall biosynthesis
MRVPRVAIVTNAMPHYNGAFYQRLIQRQDIDVHIFCQGFLPGTNLELVHERFPEHVTLVPAMSLDREQLAWQWLPWRELLRSFDVLFVMGNPRVVSSVVLTAIARLLRKRVVIWGHAHSMASSRLSEGLRLWWWKWCDHFLVYTDQEAQWLKDQGFRGHVVGMNNGLDQRGIDAAASEWDEQRLMAWREKQGLGGRSQILSCARLEPKNRFDTWLRAMPAVIARYPDLVWCVIGDGRERRALEALAHELSVAERVRWLGAIIEERELAPWFRSSQLLIHPAGIGLTLLHAFGYGVPVITHGDAARHNPEFAAFVPGETGLLYRQGDPESLAERVCECLADRCGLRRMGERARRIAREDYNVDVMAERFAAVAKHAAIRAGRQPY